jgi:predicted branched-subunit amino acid permease
MSTVAISNLSDATTERRESVRGAAEMLPLLVGYAPFAMVLGAAVAAHADPAAGWAGIWLVLGGSAHLATLRALGDGSAWLAVATGLVVNARLMVYSASLATVWSRHPRWFKMIGAALLIDPTWAVARSRAARPGTPSAQRRYYLGAAVTLSIGWCLMITAGMLVGARWSERLDLGVTVPLCLIALVGPRLLERDLRPTVIAAAAIALVARGLPAGSGLLVAVAVGALLGASRRPS